jgi:hypothetical protein
MKIKLLFEELSRIINNSNITIKKDLLKSSGGYCLLNQNQIIVLNKILPPESHCKILASCIKDLNILNSDVFIPPAVREYIDSEISLFQEERIIEITTKDDRQK